VHNQSNHFASRNFHPSQPDTEACVLYDLLFRPFLALQAALFLMQKLNCVI